jgi:hypothetical protein
VDEHRIRPVPFIDETDELLAIPRLRRDQALHLLDDVVKREAQMAALVDAGDGQMLGLGRKQAYDMGNLVLRDERLDSGIRADDDH